MIMKKIILVLFLVISLVSAYIISINNTKSVVAKEETQLSCRCNNNCNCGCKQTGSCGCKR